ncbi:MAG: hypothetical protein P8X79_05165 [Reinekea sp.]
MKSRSQVEKTASHFSRSPPEVHRFVPVRDKGRAIAFELRGEHLEVLS